MQWNGVSESRILSFHNRIYGGFGTETPVDRAYYATCPDYATATPWGAASYVKGDHVVHEEGTYWHERSFVDRVLENYGGSLYMIHGLQDRNVDPHAGWIAQLALQENGNDVKSMWGQWGHMYPDRPEEHGSCDSCPSKMSVRFDWAQDLLEWFDHYLKGTGPAPPLHHEVQQLDGAWRVEEHFPPRDANYTVITLAPDDGQLIGGPDDYYSHLRSKPITIDLGPINGSNDTLMAGLSFVAVNMISDNGHGQVFVELIDQTAGEDFGLSYGVMDIRYRSGQFEPATPTQSYTVNVPLQLFDAVLPAGHHIGLRVGHSGGGFMPNPEGVLHIRLDESELHLSTIERGPEPYFEPPA